MAFDGRTGSLLLFGGFTQRDGEEVQLADTWRWRNGCWRRLPAEGPTARSWSTLVYDSTSRAAVLFGGKVDNTEGGTFGDTWRLSRDQWTQVDSAQSPPARAHHAATWDAKAERIVLFGGSHGFDVLGDAWSWSDGQWSLIEGAVGPDARALHAMYFDVDLGGVVVHGGSSNPWPPFNLSDRWVLVGSEFEALSHGPARAYHVAAKLGDGSFSTMGWAFESNPVVASWLERPSGWSRLDDPPNGPEARAGAASAVDTGSGVVYLYGGMNAAFEPLGDFWRFDGTRWSRMLGCR